MGDGANIFWRLDFWSPGGPYEKFGHRVVYDAASSVNAKLASFISDRNWDWGHARSEDLVTILSKLPLLEIG